MKPRAERIREMDHYSVTIKLSGYSDNPNAVIESKLNYLAEEIIPNISVGERKCRVLLEELSCKPVGFYVVSIDCGQKAEE